MMIMMAGVRLELGAGPRVTAFKLNAATHWHPMAASAQ